jgi:hypothetical protein
MSKSEAVIEDGYESALIILNRVLTHEHYCWYLPLTCTTHQYLNVDHRSTYIYRNAMRV